MSFDKPRLRFMTCGSVDDGKSTLIGRLLYDSNAIFEDHVVEVQRAAGGGLDFSLFVDGLKAEREQGITIDVAHRFFATERSFAIADAPGHEQYTGNQAAAASQCDLAVMVVSAADGVQLQTRRHLAIAALFGVRDFVVVVNKMDLVGWRNDVFDPIVAELTRAGKNLDARIIASIPISAREGDNVVHRSERLPWYAGPTLRDAVETFEPSIKATEHSAILPVALTHRIEGGGRIYSGELSAGVIERGAVLRSQAGAEGSVVQLWSAGTETDRAEAGDAVALRMAPEMDLGRGAVLATTRISPVMQARARFIWIGSEPLHSGRPYDIQIACGRASAVVRPDGKLNLQSLAIGALDADVSANDIAVGKLTITPPLPAMSFDQSRDLGAFILVDKTTLKTVAAGVLLDIEQREDDLPWQRLQVTSADRARLMGQRPVVVWLTGLSGAGKSTIADLLDRRLHALGRHTAVLDGDNLRHGLSGDLGFSEEDRTENVRRVSEVAKLMADAGLIVIVALISPNAEDRARARQTIGDSRFREVFIDAPLDVCEQRDPKGMYARARRGALQRFTAVAPGSDYERPPAPDLHLRTDETAPEHSAELLLQLVERAAHG